MTGWTQAFGTATLAWVRTGAMALVAALVLAGCGGGGGGGGNANPETSVTVSTQQLSVSATTDDTAPAATLSLALAYPPVGGLYAGYRTAGGVVSSADISATTPSVGSVTLQMLPPLQVGVGVHDGTVTLYFCYDSQCARQVGGSPLVVNVRYTVTAGRGQPGAAPQLSSLSPSSAAAGGGAFTLVVTGSGFVPQSVLLWNGQARSTSYASATQLTASIPASDVATAGTATLTVSNAAAGGGVSSAVSFEVTPPAALALERVSPSRVTVGGPAFELTLVGTGFLAAAEVRWNGAARSTRWVSSTVLSAQITAADIASLGTATVTVFNPDPAGGPGTLTEGRVVTVAAASADAVSFHINPQHTGATQFANASLPSAALWSVDLGGPPSYALAAGGRVFVSVAPPSGSSQLLALSPSTGAVLWGPMILPGQVATAYDGGNLFVLSSTIGSAALLQALDPATGTRLWSTVLAGQYMFSSPPTAANGMVYVAGAGSGGTLYAVSQATGQIVWTQPVAGGDASAPTVTADAVYVTYPCSTQAFHPVTGASLWNHYTGCSGGGGGTSLLANGVLYSPNGFGTFNGTTLNAATGTVLGAYVADNLAALGSDTGYFLQSGTLRGITLASNLAKWSFAGYGQLVSSPLLVNGWVFVGSSAGKLYGLDAQTGSTLWTQDLGAVIPAGAGWGARLQVTGMTAGNGLLLVPAGNRLTAFRLAGGF